MSIENHIFCARSFAVVNTEYSCFFIPEAKGPACPVSRSPWFLFCQVFRTNKQYLPVLLCLALSACSWTMQLTWSCLFFLPPWYGLLHFIYKNTLRPYNYLDRGLQLQVQEIGCLGTLRNENMSWDIERAKGWVEQWAHPTFQFTCLFEHFETLQLRTRRTLVSYSNRFPTYFSFFSSSLNYGPLNHNFEQWCIQTFLVLDWDLKQWLIVLTHHPSIPHALQSMCISSVFGTWLWDLLRPMFSNQNWRNGSENRRQTNMQRVCRWVSRQCGQVQTVSWFHE